MPLPRLRLDTSGRAGRWRVLRLRRLAAAALAATAAWLGVDAATSAAETRDVVVALGDRPVGHVLAEADVAVRSLPAAAVPPGALGEPAAVVGHALAAPLGDGEILTGTRLRADGGPAIAADRRVVHVPLADAGATQRLRSGDRVDVLAAADGATVVADAVVVAVDVADGGGLVSAAREAGASLLVPAGRAGPLASAALGAGGVHLALRGPSATRS